MRVWRLAAVAVLLVLAVAAALLAADLRRTRDALGAGDLRFETAPATARWQAATILPGDPAKRLLGIGGDLGFRLAARDAAAVRAAGNGFDNGVSEARRRAAVEAVLADQAHSADRARASAADTLAGILAFDDSRQLGPGAPAPVERSVAGFEDAIRRDPGNEAAKFDLELLLRELVARGVRPGSGSAPGGPARGRRGAGAGLPGHGY